MESRFYYKDENNNYYSLKQPNENLIPIGEDEWLEHQQVTPIAPSPEKRERARKLDRIAELKQLLNESDYKAIKYAEGLISESEYQPIKELRQSYRDEINELESQL